jgi:hypothetical protein
MNEEGRPGAAFSSAPVGGAQCFTSAQIFRFTA